MHIVIICIFPASSSLDVHAQVRHMRFSEVIQTNHDFSLFHYIQVLNELLFMAKKKPLKFKIR